MKRNTLETSVLAVGLVIIVAALFLIFFQKPTSQSIFLTNVVFSLGFLVYIIYSMMTTNSLNHEIRRLNTHVDGLKEDVAKKDKSLKERQKRIEVLEKEKQEIEENLEGSKKEIAALEKQNSELRASQKKAKS